MTSDTGSVYRTGATAGGARSTPLAVHCSDPRFRPHFQEFLRHGLGLEHYGLLAVPGGPHCLTLVHEYLPKFGWCAWRWVTFMHELAGPPRVILIAHEDCRWYHDPRFNATPGNVHDRQVDDLHRVRRALADRFGSDTVTELYFARLEGEGVAFDRV
jgi:hypothetical protein